MIIGLAGYAGSGKNTFADLLVEHENFSQMAFADPMRQALYELNPIVNADNTGGFFRLQDLVDNLGWDKAKRDFSEIRFLLQKMGTEVGRNIIGENIWVDALFQNAPKNNLVISDVRFPNEARAIWKNGGYIIRINRPNVSPANNHSSELNFFQHDFVIKNDGEPIDMLNKYRLYFEKN